MSFLAASAASGAAATAEHKVRSVSRRACLSCRERKIKCEGVQDCRNCATLGVDCIFVPSHRGGKRRRRDSLAGHEQEQEHKHSGRSHNHEHYSDRSQDPGTDSLEQARPDYHPAPAPPAKIYSMHAPATSASLASQPTQPVPMPPSRAHSESHIHSQLYPPPPYPNVPPDFLQSMPSILQSIQHTLISLQQQINDISQKSLLQSRSVEESDYDSGRNDTRSPRHSVPVAPSSSNKPLASPNLHPSLTTFRIGDVDLQTYDLPSVPLIMFLIDVYYDCFHPEFPFMLPKANFIQSVNFETDAAMLQAMFAISCRLAAADAVAAGAGTIHPYLVDPMYWMSRSEKWTSRVTHPISKLKTALLLSFSAVFDGHKGRARDLLAYASSIVDIHRLDLLDCDSDSNGRYLHIESLSNPPPSAHAHTALLPTELERESFRRTYYTVWELRVSTAALWSSPQDVPPFSGNLRMPCCEATYADALRDFNGKYFLYDEFCDAVFAKDLTVTAEELMPLGFVRRRWRFNTACFRVASVKLLADTVAHMHDASDDFVQETDRRVRVLLQKINGYRTGPMRVHMALFVTHQILYTTMLLLHRERARGRLIFVVQPTPYDGMATYTENPISRVRSNQASVETMVSFKALVHAAFAVVDMARTLVECRGGREDSASLKMGPLMGFSLSLCIPIIASKIVLGGVQLPSIKLILGELSPSESGSTPSLGEPAVPKDEESYGSEDGDIGDELGRPELDFLIRCMKLLGHIWRGVWHEYEESVALVGRMEKVI